MASGHASVARLATAAHRLAPPARSTDQRHHSRRHRRGCRQRRGAGPATGVGGWVLRRRGSRSFACDEECSRLLRRRSGRKRPSRGRAHAPATRHPGGPTPRLATPASGVDSSDRVSAVKGTTMAAAGSPTSSGRPSLGGASGRAPSGGLVTGRLIADRPPGDHSRRPASGGDGRGPPRGLRASASRTCLRRAPPTAARDMEVEAPPQSPTALPPSPWRAPPLTSCCRPAQPRCR